MGGVLALMFAKMSPETVDPRSSSFADELGAFILDRGIIDRATLSRASAAQANTGERFDLVLTRLGIIPESRVAKLLSEFFSLRFIEGNQLPGEPIQQADLPPSFLKKHLILPLSMDDRELNVAVADPFDTDAIQCLSYLLERPVERSMADPSEIEQALEKLYPDTEAGAEDFSSSAPGGDASAEDVRRLKDLASEAPVIRLVHDLIALAVERLASDIHIEPRIEGLRIRLRLDGMLHTIDTLPAGFRAAVTSRIKIMARLNIAERRLPQDGRIRATVRGKSIDLRVSTMPTLYGESVVLRVLDRSSTRHEFEALGFSPGVLTALQKCLGQPNGIILVSGPTGSGKTTTLYTALASLDAEQQKIFTVEDPIEYELAGINQIQVQPQIGLTFSSALRSILRQDPDIIMIGEIRDLETAEIAVQASLTGHLVLSTVHTNSAAGTITRLLEMGVPNYLLASSLTACLAQRLVRRLCSCALPPEAGSTLAERLWTDATRLKKMELTPAAKSRLRRKAGCEKCRFTGYRGRTSIGEILVLNDPLRELLIAGASERALTECAAGSGMTSLYADGLMKAFNGETTVEEVLRVTREA